ALAGAVLGIGVSLDEEHLVSDHELVADLELHGLAHAEEDAVARLEVVQPDAALHPADLRLARMAEALAVEGDRAVASDDRSVAHRLVERRPARQAAEHDELEARL